MRTITYKSHVLNLVPTDPAVPSAGFDIYCGSIPVLHADVNLHPLFSLRLWLDRAIEMINLMGLNFSC